MIHSRLLTRTVRLGPPLLVLTMVLAACGSLPAGTATPSLTSTATPTTSVSFDPVADCGNAAATLDADGNCIQPTTATAPVSSDVVYQIIADCEYEGSDPCPTVNADNVQAALTTWICPNVQLTLKDTNGDVSKARSLIQFLINSGQENLVVNGRLAQTALDESLCPGAGS